uniref:Uncharacterized protein n=1 Tax=Zea mays TaxID=4577 RepID=A0A804P791_MAIZE
RKLGLVCTAQDHGCRAVRACIGWTCSSTARVRSCSSSWIERGLEGILLLGEILSRISFKYLDVITTRILYIKIDKFDTLTMPPIAHHLNTTITDIVQNLVDVLVFLHLQLWLVFSQ